MTTEVQQSPRLEALREEIASGNDSALRRFWREVKKSGTPLIEPSSDENVSLVTFLWRERERVENVAVIGEFVNYEPSAPVMERIAGTDILYRTYTFRNDLRTCYELSPNDPLTPITADTDWDERTKTWQTDPLNPRRYRVNVLDKEDPQSREKYLSVLELPAAPSQTWVEARAGGLAGRLKLTRFKSKIMGDKRRVWVYTPPGHSADAVPFPVLVMTDAVPYAQIMFAQNTLDNLILAGKIPRTVGIFVDNPNRMRDLACYEPFAQFLATELMPAMREKYNLTDDPARTVIGGTSLGGLTAAFVAMRYSRVFGCVLSQSGAFQWTPGMLPQDPEEEMEEPEWLARQFVDAQTGPLRFYMEAGILELGSFGIGHPSLLTTNRHIRDVLRARGYPVDYREFNGSHTYIVWQGTLADGLMSLLSSPGRSDERDR